MTKTNNTWLSTKLNVEAEGKTRIEREEEKNTLNKGGKKH